MTATRTAIQKVWHQKIIRLVVALSAVRERAAEVLAPVLAPVQVQVQVQVSLPALAGVQALQQAV